MDENSEHAGNEGSRLKDESYVAVVYFHGMGAPRRHEEISRLTDALDQYSSSLDVGSVGRLRNQKVFFEPSRNDDEDVAYVGINRVVRRFGDSYWIETKLRVYEGFWSPYVSGGYSWIVVFLWMASRLANPIRVLGHRWRAHQRLKIATLHRLFSMNRDPALKRPFFRLEKFYIDYEDWAARRREPSGSFAGFLRYISQHVQSENLKELIVDLARQWRRSFIFEQIGLVLIFLTILAAGIDAVLLLIFLLYSVAGLFVGLPEDIRKFSLLPPWAAIPLIGAGLPYVAIKVRYYLSTFWSDVMFWTTQEEKDDRFARRKNILNGAIKTLTHVLKDEQCKRIVVVGHSLGSAIAYESLLKLGRMRVARKGTKLPVELERLDLISHFVTIGSPIDWTHYFFELHESRYHRYNRIRDELKGSTADLPFTDEGRRRTQWINIFDKADPISTEMFSPRGRLQNFSSIQNVGITSSHLSKPIESHSAYFASTASLRVIFWLCVFGRLPKATQEDPEADYYRKMIKLFRRYEYGSVSFIIWAVLMTACISLFGLDKSVIGKGLSFTLQLGTVISCLGVLSVFAITKVADHVRPLRVDATPVDPNLGPRIP
jgi:hypothetical protein